MITAVGDFLRPPLCVCALPCRFDVSVCIGSAGCRFDGHGLIGVDVQQRESCNGEQCQHPEMNASNEKQIRESRITKQSI